MKTLAKGRLAGVVFFLSLSLLLLVIFTSKTVRIFVSQPTPPDFAGLGCELLSENTYPYPDIGVGSECSPMPNNWPNCWVWDIVAGKTESRMILHQAFTWVCPNGVNPCER